MDKEESKLDGGARARSDRSEVEGNHIQSQIGFGNTSNRIRMKHSEMANFLKWFRNAYLGQICK